MKQSLSKIKLVIIELDGCILPLNHLRYNFYKNLCKQKQTEITKYEYANSLGNMYSMYDKLPLARLVSSANLNNRVEKDLFHYLNLKGITLKEGFLELLEYFRQKQIRVAIFSTHKTSRAIEYLNLANLQGKCDYVIGSDTKIDSLPKNDLIEFLMHRYQAQNFETLIITSIPEMVKAGHQSKTNIIFYEDLVPLEEEYKRYCYDETNSFFEILNDLLFSYYNDYKMFQDVLGMNDGLTREELREIRNNFAKAYSDDQKLVDIVNKAYESKIEELEAKHLYFAFEDDEEDYPEEPIHDLNKTIALSKDDSLKLQELVDKALQNETKEEAPIINKVEEIEEIPEEESNQPSNIKKGLIILSHVLYVFALSFMILFVGIIIYVLFVDYFKYGYLSIIKDLYMVYMNFTNILFSVFINALHIIFKTPTYQTLLSNSNGSDTFITTIPVYLFNTCIIGMIYYLKEKSPKTF